MNFGFVERLLMECCSQTLVKTRRDGPRDHRVIRSRPQVNKSQEKVENVIVRSLRSFTPSTGQEKKPVPRLMFILPSRCSHLQTPLSTYRLRSVLVDMSGPEGTDIADKTREDRVGYGDEYDDDDDDQLGEESDEYEVDDDQVRRLSGGL